MESYTNVKILEQVGYGLVELIERGQINSDEMSNLLKIYLRPMIKANIDYLVLGCSHYPYLIPIIKKIIPSHVKIIDSGQAVARQTKAILEENNLLNEFKDKSTQLFYTNGEAAVLKNILGFSKNVFEKEF